MTSRRDLLKLATVPLLSPLVAAFPVKPARYLYFRHVPGFSAGVYGASEDIMWEVTGHDGPLLKDALTTCAWAELCCKAYLNGQYLRHCAGANETAGWAVVISSVRSPGYKYSLFRSPKYVDDNPLSTAAGRKAGLELYPDECIVYEVLRGDVKIITRRMGSEAGDLVCGSSTECPTGMRKSR